MVLLGCLLRNFPCSSPRRSGRTIRAPALSLPSAPWRQALRLRLQLGLELAEDAQVDRAKKIVEGDLHQPGVGEQRCEEAPALVRVGVAPGDRDHVRCLTA